MWNLFALFTRRSTVRLGRDANDPVEAYHEHLLDLWAHDSWADVEAERVAIAAEWPAMTDTDRAAVIAGCDELEADGPLDDHRFYSRWREHRRAR
jgi:hypothetical protein